MKETTTTARSEGKFQEIGGVIKKKVGHLLGDEQMELEGRAKEAGGKARQAAADTKDHVKGVIEEAVGTVENRVGHLVDSEKMQDEGRRKERAGQALQKPDK